MYDRDALVATVDLRSLADDLLGSHAGRERAPTWRCPNPQHAQTGRTPPVTIFTSRRGEERWRCHGCGSGGTAVDLVMICLGGDVRAALSELARRVGQQPERPTWNPARTAPSVPSVREGCRDPRGLDAYVASCAETLWLPEGRSTLRWLTDGRGLPGEVLRSNHVGADLGSRRQSRPEGMPRSGGAVLPVIADGRAVYAQIRVPPPRTGGPRYLNPTAALAANPRLARFRPAQCLHPEVLVTEGATDALSANAAGYRAVAVLSAAYPDRAVALALARLPHPLVIAFDADGAGRAGAAHLAELLVAEHRPPAILNVGQGDMNDALKRSPDWAAELTRAVDVAVERGRPPDGRVLSR